MTWWLVLIVSLVGGFMVIGLVVGFLLLMEKYFPSTTKEKGTEP